EDVPFPNSRIGDEKLRTQDEPQAGPHSGEAETAPRQAQERLEAQVVCGFSCGRQDKESRKQGNQEGLKGTPWSPQSSSCLPCLLSSLSCLSIRMAAALPESSWESGLPCALPQRSVWSPRRSWRDLS